MLLLLLNHYNLKSHENILLKTSSPVSTVTIDASHAYHIETAERTLRFALERFIIQRFKMLEEAH